MMALMAVLPPGGRRLAKTARSKAPKAQPSANGFYVFAISIACAVAAIRWIMTF
jgi:hypothetical protein